MILSNPRFLIKGIFLNFIWKIKLKLKPRDNANYGGIMRMAFLLKSGTRKEAYYHH